MSRINAPDASNPYHTHHGKTGRVINGQWFFLDEGGDPLPFTVSLGDCVDGAAGNPIPDASAIPWHELYGARDIHPSMTKLHEARYFPRLYELAKRCGIVLKAPRCYATGEVFLSVEHSDTQYKNTGVAGQFGQAFCDALAGVRWRCGNAQYGHSRLPLYALNGWAWVVAGDLVDALDRAGIPDPGQIPA